MENMDTVISMWYLHAKNTKDGKLVGEEASATAKSVMAKDSKLTTDTMFPCFVIWK